MMDNIEEFEIKFAEYLDEEVYLPVKRELEGCNKTYSLGIRKENLKGFFHDLLKEIVHKLENKEGIPFNKKPESQESYEQGRKYGRYEEKKIQVQKHKDFIKQLKKDFSKNNWEKYTLDIPKNRNKIINKLAGQRFIKNGR